VTAALYATLLGAAFVAGGIDAMVGGGGLVQLPALVAGLPRAPPATLLGTSKLAGLLGTASAAARYVSAVRLPWAMLLPAAAAALLAALAGAMTVSHVPPALFRPLVPVMLTVVLAYTLARKDLGAVHAPQTLGRRRRVLGMLAIAAIGYYDGFFGPGTGSFLMLLFIRHYGFDFVHAAAAARVVNVATNAAALAWFGWHGHVLWPLGCAMAAANVGGAQLGARLVLRGRARFVRLVFVTVVGLLIAKTARDALATLAAG
jgi:uncharacterized protein